MEISIGSITIPENRQRRQFDDESLNDLAESIASKGLLHPPVLHNDKPVLVCGERRLRAMNKLIMRGVQITHNGKPCQPGKIPFTTLGDLSPLEIREAELEENVIRVDLTMQERVAAIAELHELRGERNPGQTFTDTASEIAGRPVKGAPVARVSDAVAIAKHLDDPDVAKASTEKEALKIIRKKLSRDLEWALSKTADTSQSRHQLILGDSLETLSTLADSSVDVICTDPPYGIGAHSFGDQAESEHAYDDSAEYLSKIRQGLALEADRICKPQAHLYIFCDPREFDRWRIMLIASGWDVWPTPLIWVKGTNGILPRPDHGPRRTYETVLYAIRGAKPVTRVGMPDVIDLPVGAVTRRHAAEKPVSLYANLLSRSCVGGDTVLDPFCGSGPIFPAANQLSLTAIGIELNEQAYATAKLRMEGEE